MPELVPPRVVVVGDRIQVEVVGPEQAEPGDLAQLVGDLLRRSGRTGPACPDRRRAAGESGQRPTIKGAVDRAAAPLAATIRSAAFRAMYSCEVAPGPPSPGRDRTQSSRRTSTTLTPWRFCDSRLPGSSNCWKTWSYGANSTDGGELQLAHPEVQGVLHRLGRERGRDGDAKPRPVKV